MTDPRPLRIPDPAVAELDDGDGRLLCRVEQRKEADLNPVETAAVVSSLRNLADALEADLPENAQGVLEKAEFTFQINDDDPENVE